MNEQRNEHGRESLERVAEEYIARVRNSQPPQDRQDFDAAMGHVCRQAERIIEKERL